MKVESNTQVAVSDKQPLTDGAAAGAHSTLPKFAEKWFNTNTVDKKKHRAARDEWAKTRVGGSMRTGKELEELCAVMPKYAAKWFLLPCSEKQQYRQMRNVKKFGADVPPFAMKWFALQNKKKDEMRQVRGQIKTSGLAGTQQDYENAGLPAFAAKWFALPGEERKDIRVRFRVDKKCGHSECSGLGKAMGAMLLQQQEKQAQEGKGKSDCCPLQSPNFTPCAYNLPYCLMNKYGTGNDQAESDEDNTKKPKSYPAETPTFVKKWLTLSQEERQKLRSLKKYRKKNGKLAATDNIPPFADKWFALSKIEKQAWRKQGSAKATTGSDVRPGMVPGFAAQWLALPDQSKEHYRTLRNANSKDNDIPDFAAQWFSLDKTEKQRLRGIYFNKDTKGKGAKGNVSPVSTSQVNVI